MKRNYQKELDRTIEEISEQGKVPRLFLHSCCAPCSSYVLEYLSNYFLITVFYYNPNITDREEYRHRVAEQRRLIEELPAEHPISFLEGDYDPERFFEMAKGLEEIPEGGERCRRCFRLRLSETAGVAQREGYDYFTTTLSLSPLKDADTLNEIGEEIASQLGGIRYLNSDFKKRDGYKRSLELSEQYKLYRQNYCGCIYSKQERERKNTMAQLWGGRFTKDTDELASRFNASIAFDQRFIEQDIEGSKAHVRMLGRQGILTSGETEEILLALDGICSDVKSKKLAVTEEYEDIHSFVEAILIDRIGDTGKKLHTGRSRNDQVALDMRLYTRIEILHMDLLIRDLLFELLRIMEENIQTVMPGFTHLQKAQPVTLAHHVGAYFEMFKRDRGRLHDIYARMNFCPLGAGALAGTTYPLDREYTAKEMGFEGPTLNSMDSVSDRDYVIELLAALSTIMMHLSRFCEEIILWNSDEYRFVEIDDAYSTGSSIMPQKKNPDIAELVRGKTGRVYGALVAILTTMKGLPLAYNKDMQEDKEGTFDAIDTVKSCLALFTGMISTMKFHVDRMSESARGGFINATDVADYLVGRGIPFRDAHAIVGNIVLDCIEKKIAIEDMTLDELKAFCPAFEEDIYEAISPEACVNRRLTIGAPGKEAMEHTIASEREYLLAKWPQK